MNKKKWIVIVAIVGILVLGIGLSFQRAEKPTEEVPQNETISVKTQRIEMSNESSFLMYSALIQPSSTEEVSFSIVARIDELHVAEGDVVSVGQKIVTLDDEQVSNQVDTTFNAMEAAQANMNEAKSNLDTKQSELEAKRAELGSSPDYVQAQAQLDQAKLEEQEAKDELDLVRANIAPYQEKVDSEQAIYDRIASEYTGISTQVASANETLTANQAILDDLQALENSDTTSDEYTSQIAEAQSNVDDAQIEVDRLNDELSVKKNELDGQLALLTQAQEELENAEAANNVQQKETAHSAATTNVNTRQAALDALDTQNQGQVEVLEGQVESARFAYESQESAYELAKTNYENALSASDDLTYVAKTSGVVIMIVSDEGEVATPLAPVVVIASQGRIAQFGVSASDIGTVQIGNYVEVEIKGETYSGQVSSVAQIPDEVSRTYLVDVKIDHPPTDVLLGELVSAKVYIGDVSGVWIPIHVILNDTKDYVFVVEDERAIRKDIDILDLNNDLVKVNGLAPEDELIIEGMTNVKSGNLVNVVNAHD